MRAEAHGPATGGSIHYSTFDMALYAGLLLALLVAIYYGLKYLATAGSNLAASVVNKLPSLPDPVKLGAEAVRAVEQKSYSAEVAIVDGANSQTSPRKLTNIQYQDYLSGIGFPAETVVRLGNVLTPDAALKAAATAGSESAETVRRLGLGDAYVDLSLPSKGLVTLGQGIGKAAGVDVIQMGYDMRTTISRSVGDTQNAVGNFRLW